MRKPRVFIGSSRESMDWVNAVHAQLSYVAEVTPWSAGAFQVNHYPLEDLERQLDTNDFAIFIFSPDDVIHLRSRVYMSPRDNTMLEMGMFWGKLRRRRVFFLIPSQVSETLDDGTVIDELHIPSDLAGLTTLQYEVRSDNNFQAAVNVACSAIKQKIQELGLYIDPLEIVGAANLEIQRKHHILQFCFEYLHILKGEDEHKYDKLYEAFRISYDPTVATGYRVRGAAIWKVHNNEGLRYVAGNVGRGRVFLFSEYNEKKEQGSMIGVVDAYLNSKVKFLLYRQHVAYEYLVCYPVGSEFVITVHLVGPAELSKHELNLIYEHNNDLMSTINYLFGGDAF